MHTQYVHTIHTKTQMHTQYVRTIHTKTQMHTKYVHTIHTKTQMHTQYVRTIHTKTQMHTQYVHTIHTGIQTHTQYVPTYNTHWNMNVHRACEVHTHHFTLSDKLTSIKFGLQLMQNNDHHPTQNIVMDLRGEERLDTSNLQLTQTSEVCSMKQYVKYVDSGKCIILYAHTYT